MIADSTPILIGAGMTVQKEKDLEKAKSPIQQQVDAAEIALHDTGQAANLRAALDGFAAIRSVIDSPESDANKLPCGHYSNPGQTIADMMGLQAKQTFLAATGGNSPQMMINTLAERIAQGDVSAVLLTGGESFASIMRAVMSGTDKSDWNDMPSQKPEEIGTEKVGVLPVEMAHRLNFPVNYYPIFENALRHHLGHDVKTHMGQMGALMAPFTEVAAQHPQSWFPVARSADELVTVTDDNRWVGYPYPKYLNSVIRIDQNAAVILTSVGKAREMGVDESKWIYLHGCADANEIWFPAERPELHRSHAIHHMTKLALSMAGWKIEDIDQFDLYSCFPSAVEVAIYEMGLSLDDPRPFTVTGGLPYFGGAGNAYTLMSVATMMQKLRAQKAASGQDANGLCNGNGWFLTKHALGLYSTAPYEGEWQREAPSVLQAKIDAGPRLEVDASPTGSGTIDSFTVAHVAGKPPTGILLGRMSDSGKRFVANMAPEGAHTDRLMQQDPFGMRGTLSGGENGTNIFTPDA